MLTYKLIDLVYDMRDISWEIARFEDVDSLQGSVVRLSQAEREKTKELEKQKRLAQAEALRKEKEEKQKKQEATDPWQIGRSHVISDDISKILWSSFNMFQLATLTVHLQPCELPWHMRKSKSAKKRSAKKLRLKRRDCRSPGSPRPSSSHPTSWEPLVQQNFTKYLVRQSTSWINLYGNEIALFVVDEGCATVTGWCPSTCVYFCRTFRTSEVKPVQHVNLQLQNIDDQKSALCIWRRNRN